MLLLNSNRSVPLAVALILSTLVPVAEAINVVEKRAVVASATREGSQPEKAIDGIINDESRWLGIGDRPTLEVDLNGERVVTAADVYSGYKQGAQIPAFRVQFDRGDGWVDVEGGRLFDNDQIAIRLVFDKPTIASRVRLVVDDPGEQGIARLREFCVWDDDPADLPPLKSISKSNRHPVFPSDRHVVLLNQSGFNTDWPKRFTAPQSRDGSRFEITSVNDSRVLYAGAVSGGIGVFDDFVPEDPNLLYVVRVTGGDLGQGESDPFYVAPMLFQRVALEPALRMFVDARSVTGTHPGAFGCAPWRDNPFYSYSVPSLVSLYLSNPSFYDRLRVEMNLDEDLSRVLADDFAFDAAAGENALEIVQRIRDELDPPVGDSAPDILQLIHWGVSWWVLDPVSKDWAGSEEKLHPETVAIPAFFLYGYPAFEKHFTRRYYETIREWTFDRWTSAGLFEVHTKIGGFKGRYAPGWTVLPNLMMHEVALRDGRDDADRYLQAAVDQARWVIREVDVGNPLHTKGQRMSEHKTINGLVTLLSHYPEAAPSGVVEFLRDWTDVVIAHSRNQWDFRKYNDEHWSLPRHMPGMTHGGSAWNEPGNLAAFPFLAWSIASVLDGDPDDAARRARLEELAVSHFDNLWGRNPLGRHSGWRGHLDYLGVERGWPIKYRPVCAHLYTVRGALCSSAATEHYPFNPEGAYRHPEGWTAFNAAFNMGLVAANRRETVIDGVVATEGMPSRLRVHLAAPVFGPVADVLATASNGDRESVRVDALSYQQHEFGGATRLTDESSAAHDGVLTARSGETVELTYGFGFFATTSEMAVP